jgi:hypothetical protein
MKTFLPIVAAGVLLSAAGAASAQDTVIVPSDTVVVPVDTVVIPPEQETVVREYVHRNPIASINLLGLELKVGSPLPDTVELHEVPDVKYRYVVVNDHTVLVDPDTREIVEVIQ